jgi:hypothetical protein
MPNQLIHFLAPARIASYRNFLKISSTEHVYRAYNWNYAISATVFPLLGCIEMQLRDSVHKAMSGFKAPPGHPSPHSIAWYDPRAPHRYTLIGHAFNSVDKLLCDRSGLRKIPQPNTDDVVASLTFGFWTTLIKAVTPVEAPRVIPSVFPGHHIITVNQWGVQGNRKNLNDQLKIANDFRNRIAHHEPLFKFRYNKTYPRNLTQGLKNLRECVEDCMLIAKWIDPHGETALKQSNWYRQFLSLTTLDCFHSWVQLGIPLAYNSSTFRDVGHAQRAELML